MAEEISVPQTSAAPTQFVPPAGQQGVMNPDSFAASIVQSAIAAVQPVATPPPQVQDPQVPPLQPTPQPPAEQQPGQPPVPPPAPVADLATRFADPGEKKHEAPVALPELPPEQDVPDPQGMGDNAHHAFAALRAQSKQYRKLAADYRQQYENVRQQYEGYAARESALAEKLTAAEQKTKQLEEDIGKLDLERSPTFRQQYDTPIYGKEDEITSILTQNGMQANEAKELSRTILQTADPNDVPNLIGNLPTITQGMLMVKYNEANELWAKRDQALSDWRQTQMGLNAVSAKTNAVVDAQRRSELAATAFTRIASEPVMKWDDEVTVAKRNTAIEQAKAWYQQAPEDQIAAAAMEGALAPLAYERIAALEAENAELRRTLNAGSQFSNPPVAPFYAGVPQPPQQPKAQPWATPMQTVDPFSVASAFVKQALGN